MNENSLTSKLNQHKYTKGLIQPPMNTLPNQQPVFWTNDRLPEYLWLGLILMNFKRKEGIEKNGRILKEISKINTFIDKPKFSIILSLDETEQEKIYEIICNEINPKILSPLTVLYRNSEYPVFNKYFNYPECRVQKRFSLLSKAIKLYYNHQSYEATDLRYVVLSMSIFQEKIKFFKGSTTIEALEKYPYTHHDDEKMQMYRPSIRASEMMDVENSVNKEFINSFWKDIGMTTDCNPMVIRGKDVNEEIDYKQYLIEFQKKLNHLLIEQKDKSILDNKFDVIIGSVTYVLKIFNDILEKELDDSIIGRQSLRTIIEVYANIKYLVKIEPEHQNIWEEYKLYGIGKYKYALLKSRESENIGDNSHFSKTLIDIIVNEVIWEEFIDIDVRYFDNKKIKNKFEEIGEKELYEIIYEYDNNFIHGFWGAIRESSMLVCDNAAHRYHNIPDINFEQKMTSVNFDIYQVLKKFSKLIDEVF